MMPLIPSSKQEEHHRCSIQTSNWPEAAPLKARLEQSSNQRRKTKVNSAANNASQSEWSMTNYIQHASDAQDKARPAIELHA
jgi:hypothetical protein